MLTGFKHRLVEELKCLINDEKQAYSKELAIKNFKFHVPPSQDNYTAWLGASIFGSLDTLDSYSISYAKYMEMVKLPDSFEITNKYGLNSTNNN
jgi:actin-related protein